MKHGRWLWAVFLGASGALRAQDKTEPAKPPKPAVEYVEGRGMLFRSPDGLFDASLGFNLQARFTHIDLDAAAGGVDADEFRVRRFKLFLSGFAFDPRLTWRFQVAFESTAANRLLDDAWLNWRFTDAAQIQFGQYKTPFSREELYNDGFLQFPERSMRWTPSSRAATQASWERAHFGRASSPIRPVSSAAMGRTRSA